MRIPSRAVLLVLTFFLSFFANAEEKGQCPPVVEGNVFSSKGKSLTTQKLPEPSEKPAPGAKYLGRITLLSALSVKGFVCDAAVQTGINPQVDETILKRFKTRRFPSITQDGNAVPVNLIVNVNVWRIPNGEIVEFPEPKLPFQTINSSSHH